MPLIPEAAPGLKGMVRINLEWLDPLYFGATSGQPILSGVTNVIAWKERVAARPSATASLHARAAQLNMPG